MSIPPLSPGGSGGAPLLRCFTNCSLCIAGELVQQDLYFSPETGEITPNYYYRSEGVERIDLGGMIVAPGFLDLQTNGMLGVHFTTLADRSRRANDRGEAEGESDEARLAKVARRQVAAGVTGWWATIPTVEKERWKEILPALAPRSFNSLNNVGAPLLGAHVEGPYLHASKAGAHNPSYFFTPETVYPESLYGESNLSNIIKLLTLAPELPGTTALIGSLLESHPTLTISLGHSAGSYDSGLTALAMGAKCLTHTFNAMSSLNHRDPGLPGLMTERHFKPYYSIIPDGIHVHPAVVSLAYHANPSRCVLITDSIELAGLEDGIYEGHGQIKARQRREGNRVLIEGTETLVGSCLFVDECVRNLMAFAGVGIAEAVRCVTENVAGLMSEGKRGVLEFGRRADFVVLDQEAKVVETWIGGVKVWNAKREEG